MVTHDCNPSFLGDGDWENHSLRSVQAKKVHETNGWTYWYMLIIPLRESTNRRIAIQASPSKKRDPISKITRTKRASRVAQVAEYLPRSIGL
jgi:hypothetical protein